MRKLSPTHKIRRALRPRTSVYHPQNPAYKWFVLGNVMLGTFMAVLDATIVNVGLPKIMASFGVGLSTIEWVVTGYMLAMAAMLPTSGWMADKFGYKRIYFWGLFLFTFGSMLCGISNNETMLISSRVIQGLGGGMIQPLGMAIIMREFPVKQRGIALGFWAIAAAASVSFGPLIGGYLVDNYSWQLIFDVNVPVGIVALALTIIIQREFINRDIRKFDLVGFISVVIFLPVLLYALSEGNASTNAEGWSAPYILACFAISIIAFAVFITQELTTKNPLIDLRLLIDRNFGLSNLVIFIFSIGMFGSTFLLPLYLQNAMDYTALQSGAVFLPVGIIQGLMSPIAGLIADKANPKIPIIIGIILLTISLYINSDLSFLTERPYIMSSLYLRGFAMGIMFTPLNQISLLTIAHNKMAQASSITNTIRQIGGSIGVAILTTLMTARMSFHSQIYGSSVLPRSQEFHNVIHNLTFFAQQHVGSGVLTAMKQAEYLLLSNINNQAFIESINDDFFVAALITLLGVVPVIILKTKNKHMSSNQTKIPEL